MRSIHNPSSDLKTVVIDAGHGGKDPGCSGLRYKEKDVALAIALKLGKYIEQHYKDVKVIYTRSTDVFVELQERAAIANRNKADLFICIHCNASPKKDAHGSETYVMGLHKSHGNLDVAKRENSAILLEDNYKKNYDGFDPNSDEANIIFNFYQNKFLEQSLNLAAKIQKQYREKSARVDKGVHQAGFLVLWKTSMPSLLTETGFLSNSEEEKFLGSDKGQEYLARSIFKAFREYKDEMEGRKTKYDDEIEKMPVYVAPPDTVVDNQAIKNTASDSVVKATEEKQDQKKSIVDSATVVKEEKNNSNKQNETLKQEIKEQPKKQDEVTKGKVIYSVQLFISDKKIEQGSDKFKGIENIIELNDKNVYKYLAGSFSNMGDAAKLQTDARKKGFTDAFVIALKDGKRISIEEAKKQK
ncbi:MAG: N-acetylmuramoyl-L-alanine amidase [Bacteroidia bacterium]|nr:N-acetylmuramoyl-L-alanine amidase [Bacteroidia bacterium]